MFLCQPIYRRRRKEFRSKDIIISWSIVPYLSRHLTIPEVAHVNQRIAVRFKDMLALAQALTDYTIFYNGPKCGASAPDHAHFQAGNKGFMPIEKDWHGQVAGKVADHGEATPWYLNDAPRATFIRTPIRISPARPVDFIYHSPDHQTGNDEPI